MIKLQEIRGKKPTMKNHKKPDRSFWIVDRASFQAERPIPTNVLREGWL